VIQHLLNAWREFEQEWLPRRNRFELCLTASVPQNTSVTQICAERISFRRLSSVLEPSSLNERGYRRDETLRKTFWHTFLRLENERKLRFDAQRSNSPRFTKRSHTLGLCSAEWSVNALLGMEIMPFETKLRNSLLPDWRNQALISSFQPS
jgi:hypothetical protein